MALQTTVIRLRRTNQAFPLYSVWYSAWWPADGWNCGISARRARFFTGSGCENPGQRLRNMATAASRREAPNDHFWISSMIRREPKPGARAMVRVNTEQLFPAGMPMGAAPV